MTHGDDASLRKAAKNRLKAQSDLKRTAGIFVIIGAILTGVWYLSGGGYFWPAWAIFGMSTALAFMAYAGYGPRERVLSQGEIDGEMRRFRGEPPG